ncbi:MAG: ASCH domain-containing protein [Roseibium sp.]|nr:ASCH domain-containing protein [Roseibium sp.]
MKALTVWQPWASLIACGVKPYEFRGWYAPKSLIGERIAIHAAARKPKREEIADLLLQLKGPEPWTMALMPGAIKHLDYWLANPDRLPLSHVVCTVRLGLPVLGSDLVKKFGGPVNDSDRDQHSNWGWPMLDVEPLVPPEPATGKQGFWNWRVS